MTDGVRKVTDGVRKVTHDVGKVSDGVGKVSDGVSNRVLESAKILPSSGRMQFALEGSSTIDWVFRQ